MRIGIINGSTRSSSNTANLIAHLLPVIQAAHPAPQHEFELIHLINSPNHPLPLVLDDAIPVTHPGGRDSKAELSQSYQHPDVRAWSATVLEWDALLIFTPQYNWGIPGTLKNALDHLYKEWNDLPVGVVTLGGHGGGKCAAQLQSVCTGLKMKWVQNPLDRAEDVDAAFPVIGVPVDLPKEVIRSDQRLTGEEESIQKSTADILALVGALIATASTKRT